MKNFGNPERVSSLFTFVCVCLCVCPRATPLLITSFTLATKTIFWVECSLENEKETFFPYVTLVMFVFQLLVTVFHLGM